MEKLVKQVKGETLRTLIWLIIAIGIAFAFYYLVW